MRVEIKQSTQRDAQKYGSMLKALRGQDPSLGSMALLVFEGAAAAVCVFILVNTIAESLDMGVTLFFVAFFACIGLLLELARRILHTSKAGDYLYFFQDQTGYTVEELEEADRELMGPGVVSIGEIQQNLGRKPVLMYLITEHYFLSLGTTNGAYLRKLEDIVAAFHSCQIPQWVPQSNVGMGEGLYLISRQDIYGSPRRNGLTNKWCGGYGYGLVQVSGGWEKLCGEVLEEMRMRAPHIIPCQKVMADGITYDLLSLDDWRGDWARILGEY